MRIVNLLVLALIIASGCREEEPIVVEPEGQEIDEVQLMKDDLRRFVIDAEETSEYTFMRGDSLLQLCKPFKSSADKISAITEEAREMWVSVHVFRTEKLHMFLSDYVPIDVLQRQYVLAEYDAHQAELLRAKIERALYSEYWNQTCQGAYGGLMHY